MNSIRLIILNHVKLKRTVTYKKHLPSVVSLILLPKTSVWYKLDFLALNVTWSADRQWTKEDYLQKYS